MEKKIKLYDVLMMCGQDELVDIVYNGYKVVVCKPAGDLCDLLEVLDDEILNALVFKISDNYGKITFNGCKITPFFRVLQCRDCKLAKINDFYA